MSKSYDQICQELDAKIPRDAIATRDAGQGRSLDYLQGWYVIDRMNKVFGPGAWRYEIENLQCVHQGSIEAYSKTTHVCHYLAQVRLSCRYPGSQWWVDFIDVGYGDGSDKANPGKAHELASKEAVTDAVKRCAKNLGMSMGLALYDKGQENVEEAKPAPGGVKGPSTGPTPEAVPAAIGKLIGEELSKALSGSGPTKAAASPARKDVNALISSTGATLMARKPDITTAVLRGWLSEQYKVSKKEDLTDAQAEEFLGFLKSKLEA